MVEGSREARAYLDSRQIRVFRLPDESPRRTLAFERRIKLRADADNVLYICLTQEDGHLAWANPYIFMG